MEDQYIYELLYGTPKNQGMFEGYINPQAAVVGGNVGNTTFMDGGGLLNVGGGATYQPTQENKINPYTFANYNDGKRDQNGNNIGLTIKAMMDEQDKSLKGMYGNLNAEYTKTPIDTIKSLGYNTNNFGANVTKSDNNTEYSMRTLLNNILGGNLNAEASKDDYNKRLMFNWSKDF
jgi:hypothetical protein